MSYLPRRTYPSMPVRAVAPAVAILTAVATALFAAGLVLGFTLIGRTGAGPLQNSDNTVWRWAIRHRGPFVEVAKVVGTVGDAAALGVICVVLTVAAALRMRSVLALVPLTAYLGGEFEVFAIRQVIHRPRPPSADFPARDAIRGIHETSYSYPSGHAVAVTAVLFAVLGTVALAKRWAWPWAVALVVSVCVAATRLILGVHWFSDLAIGLLIGAVWGATVALVAQRLATCSVAARVGTSPSG